MTGDSANKAELAGIHWHKLSFLTLILAGLKANSFPVIVISCAVFLGNHKEID